MSLDEVRETYYEASGKASEISRQLAFAGIAVVWLLAGGTLNSTGGLRVSDDLLRVSVGLLLTLVLDLLQYAWRSLAWGIYARRLELRGETTVSAPTSLNVVALAMFWGKLVSLATAYVLLLGAVLDRLNT